MRTLTDFRSAFPECTERGLSSWPVDRAEVAAAAVLVCPLTGAKLLHAAVDIARPYRRRGRRISLLGVFFPYRGGLEGHLRCRIRLHRPRLVRRLSLHDNHPALEFRAPSILDAGHEQRRCL